jgi:ABC-type amino acid transport substrate-binding protein
MKKYILFVVLFMTVATLFPQTMRIGYYQFEPYVIFQGKDKAPGGPLGEYWEVYLIPEMKVSVKWMGPLPLLRLLKYFEQDKMDAVLLFPRDEEMAKQYMYPQTPFMTGRPGLTLLKDFPLEKISRKNDVHNLEISYVKGGYLPPFLKGESIVIDYTTKEKYLTVNLDKLMKKRVDAVFNLDIVTILFEADKHVYGDRIKTLVLPVRPIEFYTLFSPSGQGQKLLRLYNPVNNRLYKAGTFVRLTEKYIPENYRLAGK